MFNPPSEPPYATIVDGDLLPLKVINQMPEFAAITPWVLRHRLKRAKIPAVRVGVRDFFPLEFLNDPSLRVS